jgi:hypothetical protein
MAEASDIYGTAFKNGSLTLLARIIGQGGVSILSGDIRAIHYTAYLLDDQNADGRTAVTGHANVSLTVADAIFDAIQTDPRWTADAIGYNFRHVLDVSAHEVFAIAGRRYLIEYQLNPAVGQVILVRFRINVI